MFFQQWTGVNAILYYAPSIFQALSLTGNTVSLLATGVVGIVYVTDSFPLSAPFTFPPPTGCSSLPFPLSSGWTRSAVNRFSFLVPSLWERELFGSDVRGYF